MSSKQHQFVESKKLIGKHRIHSALKIQWIIDNWHIKKRENNYQVS